MKTQEKEKMSGFGCNLLDEFNKSLEMSGFRVKRRDKGAF